MRGLLKSYWGLSFWILVLQCGFWTSFGFQTRTSLPAARMLSFQTDSPGVWLATSLSRQQLFFSSSKKTNQNARTMFYSRNIHSYRNRNHEDEDDSRVIERAISFLFPTNFSRTGHRTIWAIAKNLCQEFLCWWVGIWVRLKSLVRTRIERYTIYVLECEEGKYYVGSTRDRRRRFKQHCSNRGGAVFTRKYRPIRVLKEYKRVPEAYHLGMEAQVTAELMIKFGVNNVRGAMYAQTKVFTSDDLDNLVGFLGHYNDLQYRSVRNYLNHVLPPQGKEFPFKKTSNSLQPSPSNAVQEDTETAIDPNTTEVVTLKPFGGSMLSHTLVPNASGTRRHRTRRRRRTKKCYICGSQSHLAADCPNVDGREAIGSNSENGSNYSDLG